MSKDQPDANIFNENEFLNAKESFMKDLPAEETDEISNLQEQLATEKDKYLRLFAEFENYKRRTLKERADLFRLAGSDIITSILPVLDDFERAAQANPLSEGVTLVYQKLLNILTQTGLSPMNAKGKIFDPELHEAITMKNEEDETLKNTVIEEVEKGYLLNDKVIRHAKVIVGN